MRNFRYSTCAGSWSLLILFCSAGAATAADVPAPQSEPGVFEDDDDGWIEGIVVLGAGAQPDFDGAAEYAAVPLLYLNVTAFGLGLELEGPEASLNIRPDAAFQFGPSIAYEMGRDGAANKVVDRLDKIDAAFEVGGFAAYQFSALLAQSDILEVSADLMADVSGVHDGFSGSVGASYSIAATERLRLGTEVSLGFANDSYMDTYFGVTRGGAQRSGLAEYSASGGLKDVSLGATASFNVTERWGIVGRATYSRLLGDAADSPIVKDEGSADQFTGGLGISFSF